MSKVAGSIPDLFRQTNEEWLSKARHEAQRQLMVRPRITIEHVLAVCPPPRYLKRNIVSQVFKDPIFRSIGTTRASRPIAHGHFLRVWTLNEELYSPEQLSWRTRRHIEYENE